MRIAIITGATSGMGKEMVKRIIRENVEVDEIWLLGRRQERLKKLERSYEKRSFRLFPLDLSSETEMRTFYDCLEETEARVALFVHAAGIGIMGDIAKIAQEEQEEMTRINMTSCVSLTCQILPRMEEGGQMIYFASAAAFLPQPGFAVYAASKAFVLSYVRSLRAECRPKRLKITAVCPGAVKTEFFDRAAKNQSVPAYKKLVMADPVKVVKKAWKDNCKGKEISIYGLPMKAFYLATKMIPHRVFLAFLSRKR